jgi:hypothetical protein
MTSDLHPSIRDLPLPDRMRKLPLGHGGFPVPWFVAWLNERREPLPDGEGTPDFRVVKSGGIETALRNGLCWICGDPLLPPPARIAYVVGPMCAVNRTSAEPPSHPTCATYAARACPFLARPRARRRDAGKPEDARTGAGIALMRNPGVALVWMTDRIIVDPLPPEYGGGMLFKLGEPLKTQWWAEGRPATREEVMASIDSGLPALRGVAAEDGPEALAELDEMTETALQLVPA